MIRRLALTLALAAPIAALADGPSVEPAPAAVPPGGTSSPTEVPAAAARPGPTLEVSGWVAFGAVSGLGGLDAADLPRLATAPSSERAFTMSVRQSRLRLALGLPGDGPLGRGLLRGARLQALAEGDLAGGYASGDQAMPVPRLLQAWVKASWDGPARLSVLAGQATGLMGGPHLPETLGHLAVPRFSGAGLLHRRAPQLRAEAELGGQVALGLQAAALAPLDKNTAPFPTQTTPTGVGVRSGMPEIEGRAALVWRPGGRRLLEVGLSGHAGRETYWLDGQPGRPNGSVDSWGGAADLRLDLPGLVLLGGAYAGQNLDVCGTAGSGAALWYGLDPSTNALVLRAVTGVRVRGGWGQVQWTATPGLVLLAGGGVEAPERADLPAGNAFWRNAQASGGALLDLTSRWRAGLEMTGFWTRTTGGSRDHSTQLELSTLLAF
jgi:hypothetical protein